MIRSIKDYILLMFKGIAMGAADVVPGVSGGTIAFITGIYQELIGSIKSVDGTALKLLLSLRLRDFWKKINGNFLIAVIGGIGISILSLAQLMKYLLTNHPILIWSFFFGLIIASALMIFRQIQRISPGAIISMVVGVVIAYFITVVSPAETPNTWWFVMLSGAVAICAMILPGISGSFILLLMGKYYFIMTAISELNLGVIAIFLVGALIGIISFSHLLSWLLEKFYSVTVALLTGFMIGSLNKVWPWKETLETTLNSHGETIPLLERNILPSTFETLGGQPSQLAWAVGMAVSGFLTIYIIERIGKQMSKERA